MKPAVVFMIFMLVSMAFQESIETILRNPFDLQKFKKAKGPSNSGLADTRKYYYKPDTEGVYFRFFLFRGKPGFVYSPKGEKKTWIKPGDGLQIITYKPLGKYRDDYFDPTEILIEVTSSYNDEDIPGLAFIGLDTTTLKNKLGNPMARKDSCFVYWTDNNILLLKMAGGSVRCLKYSRLNVPAGKKNLTDELIDLNCIYHFVR